MAQKRKKIIDNFKHLGEASQNVNILGNKVMSVLNKLLPNRIMSNSNIFNISVELAQDLSKMIMLNVEDSLIENNILIAQKELSVRGLATLASHQSTRPISAKGVISIKINPTVTLDTPNLIFNKTVFSSKENNMRYTMLDEQLIFSTTTVEILVPVIEGVFVTDKFVAKGQKLEKIELDSTEPIENDNITVRVNGIIWSKKDSIYDMIANDESYILKNGIVNQVDIIFGDGINGKKLNDGDTVEVTYLQTSGESGILSDEAEFSIVSGVYDSNGEAINIVDSTTMVVYSGFNLASNGESIEMTRNIAGYNSRSLAFVRPTNLQAYLSRLSIISHIDAWSNPLDNQIINLMVTPNIKNKLSSYSDYLDFDESLFVFNTSQKSDILNYIDESQRQTTNTEIIIHDPSLKKYATFIYLDGDIYDKESTKKDIVEIVAREFLLKTFLNSGGYDYNTMISKNDIESAIIQELGFVNCKVDFVSERNEKAMIDGFYELIENTDGTISSNVKFLTNNRILPYENRLNRGNTVEIGSTLSTSSNEINMSQVARSMDITTNNGLIAQSIDTNNLVNRLDENVVYLDGSTNPNLGFDEFGSILVENRKEIPFLRGGFNKRNSDGSTFLLEKPIYILWNSINGFEEI